jgi:SNF2 family DNA or RNA helicase
VYKFICHGTVEEKIDALIDSKQGLSDELLTGGDEINLTEMTNDDIMANGQPGS